jgi:hypothetical protein
MVNLVTRPIDSREPSDSTRISGARLRALKAKSAYTNSWRFAVRSYLINFVDNLARSLEQLWVHLTYSCAEQGHVLPARGWRAGSLPTCAHCGKKVKTLDDAATF